MKAIILNLIAWGTLPIMDGMAKYLSTEMHFVEVVWARYFFMVAMSLPITFLFFKKYLTWPHNFILLGIMYNREDLTFIYPVARGCAPIFVTILSALLLKEKVGIHRWGAVFVGFIGALIIIQPGFIKINFAFNFLNTGSPCSYSPNEEQ